ncbi:MAG: cyclic lactone autoinducer peptide [Treponema sp.]|nr:cyclic lactone autoinducer peptide [Treponema sp.]
MGIICNSCLNLLSKAVGNVCMFLVGVSAGTMSWAGIYEPEMPTALRPKDEEAE